MKDYCGKIHSYAGLVQHSGDSVRTVFHGYSDSLYSLAKDSLDAGKLQTYAVSKAKLDSALDALTGDFVNIFVSTWLPKDTLLSSQKAQQVQVLKDLIGDKEYGFEAVVDDSLVSFFDAIVAREDSLTFASLDFISSLKEKYPDTLQSCKDLIFSLWNNLRDQQIEDYAAHIDSLEQDRYRATRLMIFSEFTYHNAYRARDYNLHQNSFSPTFTYRHRMGLALTLGLGYYSTLPNKIGGYAIAASYDRQFSDMIGAYFSYSYFRFLDNVATTNSFTNGNLQANFTFDLGIVKVEPRFDYDLAKGKDVYGFALAVSAPIVIKERLGFGNVYLTPTAVWYLGKENLSNLVYIDPNEAATTSMVFEGVMGYEASLPLIFESSRLSVSIAPNLVFPTNVQNINDRPTSKTKPFFTFVVNCGIPIILE